MRENSVLVIDGGGRGTALVHGYSKSPHVDSLYAAPGNDSMQDTTEKPVQTFSSVKTTDADAILEICRRYNISLVDVAQDNAVESGLVDILQQEGIPCIGPTRDAGQLEWDKGWSREFMKDNDIPHPSFFISHSETEGMDFLDQQPDQPWVVKANNLAEGKGVILTDNRDEAKRAIDEMRRFGGAGDTFLLEQYLRGEEFSSFVVSDGQNYRLIGSAQDHKRAFDGDEGPNTGGMGCSTPPLLLAPHIMEQVSQDILEKTIKGMHAMGRPYTGVLYLGGMMVEQDPYVIEFNARWGDPEAEVIVPSLVTDLYALSMAVAQGDISKLSIETDGKARVVVAGTSRGYPGDYSEIKGKKITGLEEARSLDGVNVYGAGVKRINGNTYANGGRLFYIVGEGNNVIDAREKAYQAMSVISIEDNGLHFRTDIGWRDVQRLSQNGSVYRRT